MAPAAPKMTLFLEDETPESFSGRAYRLSVLRCIVWCPSEVLSRWELIPLIRYRVAPDMALSTTLCGIIPWAYIFLRSWYNSWVGIPRIPRRWGTSGSCHGHGWTREALLFRLVRSSTANAIVRGADQVSRNSSWRKGLLPSSRAKVRKHNIFDSIFLRLSWEFVGTRCRWPSIEWSHHPVAFLVPRDRWSHQRHGLCSTEGGPVSNRTSLFTFLTPTP